MEEYEWIGFDDGGTMENTETNSHWSGEVGAAASDGDRAPNSELRCLKRVVQTDSVPTVKGKVPKCGTDVGMYFTPHSSNCMHGERSEEPAVLTDRRPPPPEYAGFPKVDCFLLKRDGELPLSIKLDSHGDSVMSDLLQAAIGDYRSFKMSDSEFRKMYSWMHRWSRLRYRNCEVSWRTASTSQRGPLQHGSSQGPSTSSTSRASLPNFPNPKEPTDRSDGSLSDPRINFYNAVQEERSQLNSDEVNGT